jgi:hypothetical protein
MIVRACRRKERSHCSKRESLCWIQGVPGSVTFAPPVTVRAGITDLQHEKCSGFAHDGRNHGGPNAQGDSGNWSGEDQGGAH